MMPKLSEVFLNDPNCLTYKDAAEAGDTASQVNLTLSLIFSDKGDKELRDAEYLKWMTSAAELGHKGAQLHLCSHYSGESEDPFFLQYWQLRFLADEDPEACYHLAIIHTTGPADMRCNEKAANWMIKAADMGHPAASFGAGLVYESGRGVPQNWIEALKYFKIAQTHGEEMAKEKIEQLTLKINQANHSN